jgi:hypothetical protein
MNHCIQEGVDDGDGGEDNEGGSERRRTATASAAAQGAPSLPPASWGSTALSPPYFMASWEPSHMEMGSMGEAKTWLLAAVIRGWRSPPRVRFPHLIYSCSNLGLSRSSGLRIS